MFTGHPEISLDHSRKIANYNRAVKFFEDAKAYLKEEKRRRNEAKKVMLENEKKRKSEHKQEELEKIPNLLKLIQGKNPDGSEAAAK